MKNKLKQKRRLRKSFKKNDKVRVKESWRKIFVKSGFLK